MRHLWYFMKPQENEPDRSRSFLLIVPDKNYPRRFTGDVYYISKPINSGEMRSLIEAKPVGSALAYREAEIRGLTGNTEDFNLVGVKTAKILMTGGRGNVIYVHNGKVVHSSSGKLSGIEAFTEFVSWEKGSFCLLHGETTDDINIKADTMLLL